jgi:hypothetical protein
MQNKSLKPTEQIQASKNLWIIILFIIILIIISSGMYLWHQLSLKKINQHSQQQIIQLTNQINNLQKENSRLKEIEQTGTTTFKNSLNNIQFPVIAYGRPGLLHNTETGLEEKKNLEEKLINPYVDYHKENDLNLVAMYITVPQNIGEEYKVVAIFGNGTEQFLFGAREQSYDYWKPGCMGPCDFSEEFKEKYPQIVE